MSNQDSPEIEVLKLRIEELESKLAELGLQLAEVREERDFYASEAIEATEALAQIRKIMPNLVFNSEEDDEEEDEAEDTEESPTPKKSARQKMADIRKLLPRLCGDWAPGVVIDYEPGFVKALAKTLLESRKKAVIKAVHTLAEEGEEYPGLDTKPFLTAPQMRRFRKYDKLKLSRIALDYRLVWCRTNGTILVIEFGHHKDYYSKEW